MLESPCPRCGEPSADGLCGRCTAYLLRFEPYLLRPGLPGPSIDREVRRASAWLTLSPQTPVRFGESASPREDDAFAVQFLLHLGLPDGGIAVLTRGDRAMLHRLMRRWARSPPGSEPLRSMVRDLYAEAASLPGMPAVVAAEFRSLAGIPVTTPATIPEPLPPEPEPVLEREPEELEPPPEKVPPQPSVALPPPPPPPPPTEPQPEEREMLAELRSELDAKKEELSRLLSQQREEIDRRTGMVESQLRELQEREALIAGKEQSIADAARQLQERTAVFEKQADETHRAESERALFFLLFAMEGVGREAAKALAAAFGTEDKLRQTAVEDLAAVPGVAPEQAVVVRDAFSRGGAPGRRDLREKAQELLEEGEAEAALEVYDELVRSNPEDMEAWLNRGEVLAILGRDDDAIFCYERVLELDADHRSARSELANLLFENGDFGAAAANLQDLLRRAPDLVDDWLRRAGGLLAEGKATEATLIYNAVLEGDSQNLTASLALGDLLLAMGDESTADREYTRALQHHPDDPEALLKKGLLLDRQGRWGAAVQLFNRSIAVRWDYQDAWAAKGQVLLAQGKPKEALECFDKLLTFDASRQDAWLGKAESHFALGENDKAAETAGRAIALDRGNRDVQSLLDRLRESTDRPHEGLEVSALPPTETFDAGVLIEMADTLLEAGDPEGALRAYNEVLSRSVKDARAWCGKGRALHELERYGEAVRCFTAAVEIDPANEEYARWLTVSKDRWRKEDS